MESASSEKQTAKQLTGVWFGWSPGAVRQAGGRRASPPPLHYLFALAFATLSVVGVITGATKAHSLLHHPFHCLTVLQTQSNLEKKHQHNPSTTEWEMSADRKKIMK